MENKITAVDWFIEQLEQKGDASENLFVRRVQISIHTSDYLELKRQAKQMEKEQIMDAHYAPKYGCFNEEYYKETYGGNK
jgi:hypothetical protein